MICFGEIGRRIVGKSVESVLRSPNNKDRIPLDIAGIVCSKFTFAVIMTDKSFRRPQKSYKITSIITSFGKQKIPPQHAPNQSQNSTSADTDYSDLYYTRESTSRASFSKQMSIPQTPSKTLCIDDIQLCSPQGKIGNSSSRKESTPTE